MPDHPGWIPPMLAGDGPFPAESAEWAAEVKWDGMRVITAVDPDGTVKAFARSGGDATTRYPELEALGALAADAPLVLDGEVVALDPATGLPSFGRLQQRMTLRQRSRIRIARTTTPVTLMLFDVLVHRGEQVTGLGYLERRRLLEQLVLPPDAPAAVLPAWIGDLQAGLDWTRERQLEGVILKRLASPYQPGRRSPDWIKVKFRPTLDVLIGGWLADDLGEPRSLLVGVPEPDGLRYVGAVGSGLSAPERRHLRRLLDPAAAPRSPFAKGPSRPATGTRWVTPHLTGEVEYAETTRGGHLRQPVWKGLRGPAAE
ncbi:non-homologous end-joining DNA ligase [Streptacidiphilus cavernicola]|uniref:DNA ligase (ATP) n=1 Tax=Streptacidiphilus cavernicola TaxID=3342716 RepID=A0ABV6VQ46_9ACTN